MIPVGLASELDHSQRPKFPTISPPKLRGKPKHSGTIRDITSSGMRERGNWASREHKQPPNSASNSREKER